MAKKNEWSRSEVYELWFEYFKRSKGFKRLLDGFKGKEDYKYFISLTFKKPSLAYDPAINSYFFFREAIYKSFDHWWENEFPNMEKSIRDITEKTNELFGFLYTSEFHPENQNPKHERIDHVWVHNELCGDIVIKIDGLIEWKVEELLKGIRKIIISKKKASMEDESLSKGNLYPSKPLRFNEIKRYLQVYDLRNENNPKLKWREIGTKLYSKREWNESVERALHIDYNNAKKIIQNVEKGIFPGKY